MKQTLIDFNKDPNVGLHGLATDKFAILGVNVMEKDKKTVEETLGVATHNISIMGTDVVGIFIAANSNGIVAPALTKKEERKKLAEIGIPVTYIDSKHTALGNLILCNDSGALISPLLKDYKDTISKALKVNVAIGTVSDLNIVGSAGIATNMGCLVHPKTAEAEAKIIEKTLGVKVDVGSANFGTPFVKAGLIANTRGLIIGNQSSGPEITRIVETLGE